MDDLKSLEVKIEERKQEAQKKDIVHKCYVVAEILRSNSSKPISQEHFSSAQAYSDFSFRVYTKNGLGIERAGQLTAVLPFQGEYWYADISLRVYHEEKIVFKERKSDQRRDTPGKSHIELYIPGPWEKILERAYVVAEKKRVQNEKEEREEEVRKAKKERQLEKENAASELERKMREDKKKAEELRRKWEL